MPLQITEAIEATENFSSERIDYDKYEAETIEKLLTRVKECNRDKAKELIYHCINDNIIALDIFDIDDCFSDATEIEYLEFADIQTAESHLSKRGAIKDLLFVISSGQNDELTLSEVGDCLIRIESASRQKLEPDKLIWSQAQESPVGYLQMLVQF